MWECDFVSIDRSPSVHPICSTKGCYLLVLTTAAGLWPYLAHSYITAAIEAT